MRLKTYFALCFSLGPATTDNIDLKSSIAVLQANKDLPNLVRQGEKVMCNTNGFLSQIS